MVKRVTHPARWQSLLLAGLLASTLVAQDGSYPGQGPGPSQLPPNGPQGRGLQLDENQPGRAVARISLISGDVSVRRGDSGDWVAAVANAPLVTQDRVLSGQAGRAEVQLDYSNIVRLAPNTEIRVAELEYNRYMIQLASGTITFRVLRESQAEVEISTPAAAMRPTKRGVYRISISPDGTTEITVRAGAAEISTPGGSESLRSGHTMWVRGNANDPEFQVVDAVPRDEWDQWNEARDHDLERSISYHYVSPSITGAEDLDNNGQWAYDAPYGNVWVPRVDAGWAPYRNGRWAWVDFYGWSWIGYDSWGWAPYHYGRWYYGSRGWCWWPGAVRNRQYWSPGLVAFVGFGGGVGVGAGFGNIGWIPLAPYEAYHPWYGWGAYRGYGSHNYSNNVNVVNNANVVNNVNVTSVYRNARVANGITAVNSSDFTSGRFRNAVRISGADLRQASLVRGQLPVAPGRAALRLSDREVATTPRSSDAGRFFSRRTVAPNDHVSFEDQRRGVEDLSRRTFGGSSTGNAGVDSLRNSTTGTVGGRVSDPGAGRTGGTVQPQDSNGGWRRFGEPRGGTSAPAPSGSSPGSSSVNPNGRTSGVAGRDGNSWRRFGEPGEAARATEIGRSSRVQLQSAIPTGSRDNTGGGRLYESNPGASRLGTNPLRSPSLDTSGRETPRQSPERKNNMSGGEQLTLSPAIVRERPSQRANDFGNPGGNGVRAASVGSYTGTHNGGNNNGSAPRGSASSGGGVSQRGSGGSNGGSHANGGRNR